ncbi:hypothetical protein PUNSTDRAFT_141676 [Punctularia strigosozonata HHB-11173 SS5]|uniref:uncharacterized protein n=1 Tax=Punctularia strigosozonata (strain HHB-11173) TaxID=741275 RepID=UPI0004417519|nr:uncharacterized protein PUNSTDRAFT_141676 [Punctularia strigosozonata HHB-11173 SS5]EIN11245.1 hypothetical protein PUNSTDRAFT_141676 [Punctularia strigosozonata HHB-11173 SS5]
MSEDGRLEDVLRQRDHWLAMVGQLRAANVVLQNRNDELERDKLDLIRRIYELEKQLRELGGQAEQTRRDTSVENEPTQEAVAPASSGIQRHHAVTDVHDVKPVVSPEPPFEERSTTAFDSDETTDTKPLLNDLDADASEPPELDIPDQDWASPPEYELLPNDEDDKTLVLKEEGVGADAFVKGEDDDVSSSVHAERDGHEVLVLSDDDLEEDVSFVDQGADNVARIQRAVTDPVDVIDLSAEDEHESFAAEADPATQETDSRRRSKRQAEASIGRQSSGIMSRRQPKRKRRESTESTVSASDDSAFWPPEPAYTVDVGAVERYRFQRRAFHLTYKGQYVPMIVPLLDGQVVLMIKPTWNPLLPNRPGAHGEIWANKTDILEHSKWKLIVQCPSSTPQTWEYLGDYKVSPGGSVKPQVFMSQSEAVRNEWGNNVVKATAPGNCYTPMRKRIAARKKERKQSEKVECADVIQAIESGEEEIRVIATQFIGYDSAFVEKIKATAANMPKRTKNQMRNAKRLRADTEYNVKRRKAAKECREREQTDISEDAARSPRQQRDRIRTILGELRATNSAAQNRIDELDSRNSDLETQNAELSKRAKKWEDKYKDLLKRIESDEHKSRAGHRKDRSRSQRKGDQNTDGFIDLTSDTSDAEVVLVKTEDKDLAAPGKNDGPSKKRAAEDRGSDDEKGKRKHATKRVKPSARDEAVAKASSSDDQPFMPPTPVFTMDVKNIPSFKFRRNDFHDTYKGSRLSMTNRLLDGQMVLLVNTGFNPTLPARPGGRGTLWCNRAKILEHKTWKLIVKCKKSNPQLWEYRGDYQVSRGSDVPAEEFMKQSSDVRELWAKSIAGPPMPEKVLVEMRSRIDKRKKQRKGPNAGDVTSRDVLRAFETGEEALQCINMKFVGYDEPFVERIKATARAGTRTIDTTAKSARGNEAGSSSKATSKKAAAGLAHKSAPRDDDDEAASVGSNESVDGHFGNNDDVEGNNGEELDGEDGYGGYEEYDN